METWVAKIDQSLVRYFLEQLLDMIESPYSIDFLNYLLRIIRRPNVIEALKTSKKRELLRLLIEHCVETDYGWDTKQKELFQEILPMI